jgi:hypothetical protein
MEMWERVSKGEQNACGNILDNMKRPAHLQ